MLPLVTVNRKYVPASECHINCSWAHAGRAGDAQIGYVPSACLVGALMAVRFACDFETLRVALICQHVLLPTVSKSTTDLRTILYWRRLN